MVSMGSRSLGMRSTSISTSQKYPEDEIKWDMSKINLVTIDIEVQSEYGFPDPWECNEEMLTISIQDYNTKAITTWGRKPYYPYSSQCNLSSLFG